MAAKEFDIPVLPTYLEIPEIKEGVMEGDGPFKSSEQFQNPLGFPGEKVDNWQEVAIEKMGELKSKYRSVQVFLDSCVKCGACTDKCHYFLGSSDPKNMPVARQDLFRSVYRRHFTFGYNIFVQHQLHLTLHEQPLNSQRSQCRMARLLNNDDTVNTDGSNCTNHLAFHRQVL